MSENNNIDPKEDQTQTLNRMNNQLQSLDLRVTTVENTLEAQAKTTNRNLLEAFAEILRTALEPINAAITELQIGQAELKAEVNGLRAEVNELRTEVNELRTEVNGVKAELADFRSEMRAEIKDMKMRFRVVDRRFEKFMKDMDEEEVVVDDLENRVIKLESIVKQP